MYQLLDGKKVSAELLSEITEEVKKIKQAGGRAPHLAAILVGADPASETYVASKVRHCEQVGFDSTLVRFDANVSEKELLQKIQELNNNKNIDGYIVQLPLPKSISEKNIIEAIDPKKDVDGFHPVNV